MSDHEHIPFHTLISSLSQKQLLEQMNAMVSLIGEQKFCETSASHLVSMVFLEKAVPESLRQFRSMIVDGITYFISQCSYKQLQAVILKQWSLPMDCSPAERLLNVLEFFPTLHKLGQIVARRPDIDPFFQQFLRSLEHGRITTELDEIQKYLEKQLAVFEQAKNIQLGTSLIGEASVAAVVPFNLKEGQRTVEGVFKILRPGITEQLERELAIIEDVFHFFEENREKYPIGNMDLSGMLREIREDMRREMDLAAERHNLEEAARFYTGTPNVHIPRLFSFCNSNMSAMERLTGVPLSKASFSASVRKRLARHIFETVICRPLFSLEEMTPFHGDPHAGNIFAIPDSSKGHIGVGLIDWTLAAYLPKKLRESMVDLIIAITTADQSATVKSLEALQVGKMKDVNNIISDILEEMGSGSADTDDPMKRSFRVLEKLTMAGLVFPPELILFRKSFFTLEGVLLDLCDNFSPGKTMQDFVLKLIFEELPARVGNSFVPWQTSGMDYQSMISDTDLNRIVLSNALTQYKTITDNTLVLWKTQALFLRDFLQLFSRPIQ